MIQKALLKGKSFNVITHKHKYGIVTKTPFRSMCVYCGIVNYVKKDYYTKKNDQATPKQVSNSPFNKRFKKETSTKNNHTPTSRRILDY